MVKDVQLPRGWLGSYPRRELGHSVIGVPIADEETLARQGEATGVAKAILWTEPERMMLCGAGWNDAVAFWILCERSRRAYQKW